MKRIFKIQGRQIKCDDDGVANAHNGQGVSIVRPLHISEGVYAEHAVW